MEESTEDDDDAGLAERKEGQLGWSGGRMIGVGGYLDDEDDDWVFGVIHRGIGALEDTALMSSTDSGGSGGGTRDRFGDDGGDGARHDCGRGRESYLVQLQRWDGEERVVRAKGCQTRRESSWIYVAVKAVT